MPHHEIRWHARPRALSRCDAPVDPCVFRRRLFCSWAVHRKQADRAAIPAGCTSRADRYRVSDSCRMAHAILAVARVVCFVSGLPAFCKKPERQGTDPAHRKAESNSPGNAVGYSPTRTMTSQCRPGSRTSARTGYGKPFLEIFWIPSSRNRRD